MSLILFVFFQLGYGLGGSGEKSVHRQGQGASALSHAGQGESVSSTQRMVPQPFVCERTHHKMGLEYA